MTRIHALCRTKKAVSIYLFTASITKFGEVTLICKILIESMIMWSLCDRVQACGTAKKLVCHVRRYTRNMAGSLFIMAFPMMVFIAPVWLCLINEIQQKSLLAQLILF